MNGRMALGSDRDGARNGGSRHRRQARVRRPRLVRGYGRQADGILLPMPGLQVLSRLAGSHRPVEMDDGELGLAPLPEPPSDHLLELPGISLEPQASDWLGAADPVRPGRLSSRAYLLHGPAGSGKTALVTQARRRLLAGGAVVLDCSSPALLRRAIDLIARIEPGRPIACLLDGIDEILRSSELVGLLDDASAGGGILVLAISQTVDYGDNPLLYNPGRLSAIIPVGPPAVDVQRHFYHARLGTTDQVVVERYVRATRGYLIGVMAEVVERCRRFGITPEEAMNHLKETDVAVLWHQAPGLGFDLGGRTGE